MALGNHSYDSPLRETYRFPAATLSSAAVVGRLIGPAGRVGRVVNVSHVVTTNVTVAAAAVTVGNNGEASPVTHTVPISSANAAAAIARDDSTLLGQGETYLAADTLVEVASDGGPTAGAADLIVTIDWY